MVGASSADEARALFDFHGYVVSVEGPVARTFDAEYRRFRTDEATGKPRLSILPGETPRRDLIDPAFDVLPDGIEIDRREPVIRYAARARTGLLLELTELAMHWPDKVLVHAASTTRENVGFLIAAPNATGKTSSLVELLCSRHGFLADDWSLVDRHGRLYPFPKSIHVYDYNLAEVDSLRGRVPGLHPWAHGAWGLYGSLRTRLHAALGERARFFLKHVAKKRTWHLDPGHFGTHVGSRTSLRVPVWLQRDDVPSVEIAPIESDEFARRAVSYLQYDRAQQLRMIHRLAAFGEARWLSHVKTLPRRSEAVLNSALARSPGASIIRIPRKARPREIADAIASLADPYRSRRVLVPL